MTLTTAPTRALVRGPSPIAHVTTTPPDPYVITYARMQARDWDGASYDRISAPQEALGRAVLARMELRGDETVLDAGCGSGRVTEALLERLPRGRVIAVDASPSMVEQARGASAGSERVEVRQMDLLELELEEPVDAILSTATFHWILDHDALFRRLHAALRPGGQLVAQCGGEGNIDRAARRRQGGARARTLRRALPRLALARGTTPRPGRPASACSPPASPPRSAGCSRRRNIPSSRASSSPR